jgi:uncharacterized protein YbaR (Trm112 family)
MYIELTDHLRCPAPHDESFLVLIPDEIVDRSIRRGILGCPVCHREYPIVDGVAVFGSREGTAERPERESDASVDAEAVAAFLGLAGPGGYAALVGDAARYAPALGALLPGVHFVAINPPEGTPDSPGLSVLRAELAPIKSRALRGVVLGGDCAPDPRWQAEAARIVLPGLRVVGSGPEPESPALELMASAGGWWVGRKL